MKDYLEDFKGKIQDESFSDADLVSIALNYIEILQKKIQELEPEDEVTIICYGKERKMKRIDAIREFTTAAECCEGSERDRYVSICAGLKQGKNTVDDEWRWCR